MPRKPPSNIAQLVAKVVEVAVPIIAAAVTEAVSKRLTRSKVAEGAIPKRKAARKAPRTRKA